MAWQLQVLCGIGVYIILGCLYRTPIFCWFRGEHKWIQLCIGERFDRRIVHRCWYCMTVRER